MNNWIILALLSAVFASLVAIFGKIGIKNVDSTLATTVRALVMASFLLVVSVFTGTLKKFGSINTQALVFIIFSGLAGAMSWLFYFLALTKGPASGIAALDRLSVVFVVVFSILILGENFTWKLGLGAIFITLGALLMTLK